jgi:peptidyl-tRNA hydrolase, PTH1 family
VSFLRLLTGRSTDDFAALRMVVGLGNPGEEYVDTPHNIGFAVVQALASRSNVGFRRGPKPKMESVRIPGSPSLILMRPMSFMNLSGQPVVAAMKWFSLKPEQVMVVCDDVNLPLGRIRIRRNGGAGGQKGLLSIIQTLGTEEIGRLRIGVDGGSPGADVASHVLSKFRGDRKKHAIKAADEAADAIECWLHEGIEAAMNKYNQQNNEA